MNRWWGSSNDSDRQAAERSQRQARRTIKQLPSPGGSDSDGEYEDCDTSLLFAAVDGADDADLDQSTSSSASTMPTPAEMELTRQQNLPVEDADFDNDSEAWKKEIKVKYDANDVEYFFNTAEAQMKKHGINRQWDKKDAIVPVLPDEVVEECKHILRLSRADAGQMVYKNLKQEILNLYGQREEDAFKKACSLKLTGKPSALGKKLIHVLCPSPRPFETCHCARIVFGFWEAELAPPIKTKLAGHKFNKDTYVNMFKLADEAWLANGGTTNPPAVVAAVSETPSSSNSPTAEPQVAAFSARRGNRGGRGSGRGGFRGNQRGGRGSYRGGNNSNNRNQNQNSSSTSTNSGTDQQNSGNKPHQKGPKHPDLPSSASWACAQHWKKGRGAPYCSDPLTCQWNQVIAPRSTT